MAEIEPADHEALLQRKIDRYHKEVEAKDDRIAELENLLTKQRVVCDMALSYVAAERFEDAMSVLKVGLRVKDA